MPGNQSLRSDMKSTAPLILQQFPRVSNDIFSKCGTTPLIIYNLEFFVPLAKPEHCFYKVRSMIPTKPGNPLNYMLFSLFPDNLFAFPLGLVVEIYGIRCQTFWISFRMALPIVRFPGENIVCRIMYERKTYLFSQFR